MMEPPTFASQASHSRAKTQLQLSLRLLELYTHVHVDADTVYHNRTSVITLAEGLLLVAYSQVATSAIENSAAFILPALGLILSVLWVVFEQRNLAYFHGRGAVLECIERSVHQCATDSGLEYHDFWAAVPQWVHTHARWYQRHSAQRIQRVYLPALFAIFWLLVIAAH